MKTLKYTNQTVIALTLSIIFFSCPAFGQEVKPESNAAAKAIAPQKPLSPMEALNRKVSLSKTLEEYVLNLAEFLNTYPYYDWNDSNLYQLRRYTKDVQDSARIKAAFESLVKNTANIPLPLRANLNWYCADIMSKHNLYPEAIELIQKSTALNEAELIAFEQKQWEWSGAVYKQQYPDYKAEPFDLSRAKFDYLELKTISLNTLGKSLEAEGKSPEAQTAYQESFDFRKTKESALGLAKAAEKAGKPGDALTYAAAAIFTGRLNPDEMNYFSALYSRQHGGKTEGEEEYLNAEYRKTYRNPIKSQKYSPSARRSSRTVLAELFTGTGCIPCIPYDYSVEKVIEDYSPKEVALLVYHVNAPVENPLSNYSALDRQKYYQTRGAPIAFVDGKKLAEVEDVNLTEEDPGRIQETFDSIDAKLKSELGVPATAHIKLKSKIAGSQVKVGVAFDQPKDVGGDVSLSIALVENQTVYSGQNGMRFQVMVVRALAGDNDKRMFGLKSEALKSGKYSYVFDLDKVTAQNGDYYKTYKIEKEKEIAAKFAGKLPEDFSINFPYPKNQMNAKNLSVVVFLQNDKTKEILQSAMVNLTAK